MSNYYVSGCVANGESVSTCDDDVAQFWTLYHRNDEGLSTAIIDCMSREDAVAAMLVYEQRDALAALAEERRQFIVNGVEMGDILLPVIEGDPATGIHERCLLKPKFAYDAYLNSVRAEGVDYVAEAIGAKCAELKIGSKDWKAIKSIVFTLGNFADQLRAGKDGE